MTPRMQAAVTLLLILAVTALVGAAMHLAARALFAAGDRLQARRRRLLADAKALIDERIAELQRRADDRLDTCPDLDEPAGLPLSAHDRWWLGRVGLDLDATGADR